MGKARKQRRAAKNAGSEGEEPTAESPRKQRKAAKREEKAAKREERQNATFLPSLGADSKWKLRSKYSAMTIVELERLLQKYAGKPRYATHMPVIRSVLKRKKITALRTAAARAEKVPGVEPPRRATDRRRGVLGAVQAEIYLFRTRKQK